MRFRARALRSNAESAEIAEKISLCVLCGLCVLFVSTAACRDTNLFRQYEYEEDVYLSLDGSATVYVNGSLAALNALRGASFDPDVTRLFLRRYQAGTLRLLPIAVPTRETATYID